MRATVIIIATLMLNSFLCTREKNPVDPFPKNNGNHHLIIKTDKNVYSWQQSESGFMLNIQGTLENKSETTFYSRIGDGFGPQEQDRLFIAGNSAGHIEKYDKSDSSWDEVSIAQFLIEGSRFVPLKIYKIYAIRAHLSIKEGRVEKGEYRVRIDYYAVRNPGEDEVPFQDFSNTFEIR